MIEVIVRNPEDEESFKKAMKIFIKKCKNDGFMKEIRDRRYYKKPSEKRKLKRELAKKNRNKKR